MVRGMRNAGRLPPQTARAPQRRPPEARGSYRACRLGSTPHRAGQTVRIPATRSDGSPRSATGLLHGDGLSSAVGSPVWPASRCLRLAFRAPPTIPPPSDGRPRIWCAWTDVDADHRPSGGDAAGRAALSPTPHLRQGTSLLPIARYPTGEALGRRRRPRTHNPVGVAVAWPRKAHWLKRAMVASPDRAPQTASSRIAFIACPRPRCAPAKPSAAPP
jgi:hypothetical protein